MNSIITIINSILNPKPNNTNRSIDALFILVQHQPDFFAPDMLRIRATCNAFEKEKSFQNIIAKQSFGMKKRTLLMYAVKNVNIKKVKYMLENYKFDINIVDKDWKSAFTYAYASGNTEMIKELLNNGANMEIIMEMLYRTKKIRDYRKFIR